MLFEELIGGVSCGVGRCKGGVNAPVGVGSISSPSFELPGQEGRGVGGRGQLSG